MSTTLLMVIGILIASLGTIAGFVYYDMDSGSALENGLMASGGIAMLNQSVASYAAANGGPPESVDDLKGYGEMPDLPRFPGAAWSIGNAHICLYGTSGTIAERSIADAAVRLGDKAIVSGTCGSAAPKTTSVVLSYPMAS